MFSRTSVSPSFWRHLTKVSRSVWLSGVTGTIRDPPLQGWSVLWVSRTTCTKLLDDLSSLVLSPRTELTEQTVEDDCSLIDFTINNGAKLDCRLCWITNRFLFFCSCGRRLAIDHLISLDNMHKLNEVRFLQENRVVLILIRQTDPSSVIMFDLEFCLKAFHQMSNSFSKPVKEIPVIYQAEFPPDLLKFSLLFFFYHIPSFWIDCF